jgi:hypothetical protein
MRHPQDLRHDIQSNVIVHGSLFHASRDPDPDPDPDGCPLRGNQNMPRSEWDDVQSGCFQRRATKSGKSRPQWYGNRPASRYRRQGREKIDTYLNDTTILLFGQLILMFPKLLVKRMIVKNHA